MKETKQEDPDLAMAVELAKESSYTRAELEVYDKYLDAIRVEQMGRSDSKAAGKAEGIAEGRAEGKTEGKIEVAKELIIDGMAIDKIAKLTKLKIEQIEALTEDN